MKKKVVVVMGLLGIEEFEWIVYFSVWWDKFVVDVYYGVWVFDFYCWYILVFNFILFNCF